MTVLLTGWSGHALASTRGGWAHPVDVPRPTPRPGAEIGYIVRRDAEGTLRLTVSLGESVFSKAVSSNGATVVSMTSAAGGVASVAASHRAIIVSRGKRSVTVNVNGGHDDQLARVRALLLGSGVIRAVRTLATVLEESGTDAPEKMGVRLSGALLGQLDGDTGAVRRLSRELQGRYVGTVRRKPTAQTNSWATYQAGVIRAAEHLETALDSFYFFNPMRQVSSFVWIQEVERLWFEYFSCFIAAMPPGAATMTRDRA